MGVLMKMGKGSGIYVARFKVKNSIFARGRHLGKRNKSLQVPAVVNTLLHISNIAAIFTCCIFEVLMYSNGSSDRP